LLVVAVVIKGDVRAVWTQAELVGKAIAETKIRTIMLNVIAAVFIHVR
jgi:uncharacterized protein YabE (DUF348 family)